MSSKSLVLVLVLVLVAQNGTAAGEVRALICGLRGSWLLGRGESNRDGELRELRERVGLAITGDDE